MIVENRIDGRITAALVLHPAEGWCYTCSQVDCQTGQILRGDDHPAIERR